ncbi:hypothetical protein R1flu_007014 [Riccia fluitans]|uniref:Uncharacterized protein n=1 Tax=Riccia fluitans TaxID=41844 RepID=A0ABD1YXY2_9MARC
MTLKGKEKVMEKSVEMQMRGHSHNLKLDSLPRVNTLDICMREDQIRRLNLMFMLWDWRILVPSVMKELKGKGKFVVESHDLLIGSRVYFLKAAFAGKKAKHFLSKDRLRKLGKVTRLDEARDRRGEVGIQDVPSKKHKRLSRQIASSRTFPPHPKYLRLLYSLSHRRQRELGRQNRTKASQSRSLDLLMPEPNPKVEEKLKPKFGTIRTQRRSHYEKVDALLGQNFVPVIQALGKAGMELIPEQQVGLLQHIGGFGAEESQDGHNHD